MKDIDAYIHVGNITLLDRRVKIGIVGSRDTYSSSFLQAIEYLMGKQLNDKSLVAVSGGAKGVDTTVANHCKSCIVVLPYLDRSKYLYESEKLFLSVCDRYLGKQQYIQRNICIVEVADIMFCVDPKINSGTFFTLEYSLRKGKPTYVIYTKPSKDRVLVSKKLNSKNVKYIQLY